MFERLSKSAKAAVSAACVEAAGRGESATDDVDLLIGCVTGRSRTSATLKDLGVTRQRIIELLDGLDEDEFDDDDVRALHTVGIDLGEVIRATDEVFGTGALDRASLSPRRGPTRRAAPLGPSAKAAISHALFLAVNERASRIEASHLLLGVLHDPSPRCRAVTFLLDLDYDAVSALLDESDAITRG